MFPLAILGFEVSSAETAIRMLLAVVLGGAVGLEREFHGRPAGLRTHIMVCLGATLAMLAAGHLSSVAPETSALRVDPGRIAAGILTGIGFIGAGAILRLKSIHRGLTTAACIWFVAALGVVIGVGAYGVALGGTGLALFVLLVLKWVDKAIRPHWYREVVVTAERSEDLIPRVRGVIDAMKMRVQWYDYQDEVGKGEIRVTFNVRFRERDVGEELLKRLRELPGVRSIEWRAPAV